MLLFAAFFLAMLPFDDLPTELWIGLSAGVVVLTVFVILLWVIVRHLRKSREFSHAERMKALELGQPLSVAEPDRSREKYGHNAFWIAFWLGMGVPSAAVSAASSTTIQGYISNTGLLLAIWIGVAAICVASVVCATVLMVSARPTLSEREKTAPRGSVGDDVR
jgi:uncharacterized membrane protein